MSKCLGSKASLGRSINNIIFVKEKYLYTISNDCYILCLIGRSRDCKEEGRRTIGIDVIKKN